MQYCSRADLSRPLPTKVAKSLAVVLFLLSFEQLSACSVKECEPIKQEGDEIAGPVCTLDHVRVSKSCTHTVAVGDECSAVQRWPVEAIEGL